jgi:hypothetical protein
MLFGVGELAFIGAKIILKFLQYEQNWESIDADYLDCFEKSHEIPICEEWIY